MYCCIYTWTVAALTLVGMLTAYLLCSTGNIGLFWEITKLHVYGVWCCVDAFFSFIAPRKQKNLKGLTALITGAAGGIGKEITMVLVRKGVKVILWDINEEHMKKVADEVKAIGGEAFCFLCDVTNREEVYKTADKVKENVGIVDILINNAAVVSGKQFHLCSDEDIERTMNVNLMAHFWTLKAFYTDMLDRDSGHVVCISSIMGLMGCCGLVDYCTSKSAVTMMMEILRQEARYKKKLGVGFTTIHPSKVDTGMFEGTKTRFSMIPPTLKPEYVAEKTVDAIEQNASYVILPKWMALQFALTSFLPQKFLDEGYKFTKLDEAMEYFVGHDK